MTDSSLWCSSEGIGSENKAAENPLTSKKLFRIALRLPHWARVLGKFKFLKIGTVFEDHFYELFEGFTGANQKWFPIENLTIGIQQRQTRNVTFNIQNFLEK